VHYYVKGLCFSKCLGFRKSQQLIWQLSRGMAGTYNKQGSTWEAHGVSSAGAGAANGTAAAALQSGKKRKKQREAVEVDAEIAPEQPPLAKKKKRRGDSHADATAADVSTHKQRADTQQAEADIDAVVRGKTRDKSAAKAAKRTGKKLSAW
jgi:hypothetical protein